MDIKDIKFKAKRLDTREWVEGSLIKSYLNSKEQTHIMPIFNKTGDIKIIEVNPSTVCMFTGFKDREGNEIYEHDIISIFEGREPCEVIFEKGCFLAFNPRTHMRMPLITGINDYDWELHVVGNKFDKENKI